MDDIFYKFAKQLSCTIHKITPRNPTILRDDTGTCTVEYYSSLSHFESYRYHNMFFEVDRESTWDRICNKVKRWWVNLRKQPNPCRVGHSTGKIQLFSDGINKKSTTYILFMLLWCYYKYNNGNIIDDITADNLALRKLLATEKIDKNKFVKEYILLIKYASGNPDSNYSVNRIELFMKQLQLIYGSKK